MKKYIVLSLVFLFSAISYAYEINGNIIDDGSGEYTIQAQDDFGRSCGGSAQGDEDELESVNITCSDGHSMSGTAIGNGDSYSLDLQDTETDTQVDGTLNLE